MQTKEQEFFAYLKEISLLKEAVGLLEYDSQTGMPDAGAQHRAEVSSYLSGMIFDKEIHDRMPEFIEYFEAHPNELSELGQQVFRHVKKNYDLNYKIPADQFQAYMKTISEAHHQWLKAREEKDFKVFQPSLEKIVGYLKEFIPLWRKNEKNDYDVLLDQYEPGMTTEILDQVFKQVKDGIMEIRQKVAEKGVQPDTSFLNRTVTREQQEKFVRKVVADLGYDFSRGRLDDTVHPFMLAINREDARITTRWNEDDFSMAVFGVIHEAGHGMYEQNIDSKFDYTPLATGVSMGIHESQSLFNEIIVGSNRAFWEKQYPFFQEVTDGTFDEIDFETFYRGLNETKASLIRIESDKLTYPLHIIIRYEIEKMIFNEGLPIERLPQVWAHKYEEYLGIRPANDLEGVLQDVHWSGGSFGYFPSYALGYMYAAQLAASMKKDLDIDEVLSSDDYSAIRMWLTEHIHQYGASKEPNDLLMMATGESLNPQYLLDYMRDLYYRVYQIED